MCTKEESVGLKSLVKSGQSMDISLTTPLLLALAIVSATTWYALDYFYVPKQLPNEPPLVGHYIPYIGHIIGLIRHGTRYYQIIRYIQSAKKRFWLNTYTLLVLVGISQSTR